METLKEKLFLIPKGSNGLRLHPRAFVDEHMKSYEKATGVLLPLHKIQKMEADKKELLEALEKVKPLIECFVTNHDEIESLIQKHKQ